MRFYHLLVLIHYLMNLNFLVLIITYHHHKKNLKHFGKSIYYLSYPKILNLLHLLPQLNLKHLLFPLYQLNLLHHLFQPFPVVLSDQYFQF